MALVKYGGGIIQMTGSIAGNTYARNRYGNYARARTKPTNPNTDLQQVVRGAMATLTARWSQVVTAVQRTAWNLYAQNVAMKNRLGESVYLSGINHYLRSNIPLMQAGKTIVDAGPVIFELPEKDASFSISISEATQLIVCAFDDTAAWCDEDEAFLHIAQGVPQNPQRNFFGGPYKMSVPIEGDSVAPPSTGDDVACTMLCTETQKVWVQARIQRADGRLSEPFRSNCFCAA